MHNTPNLKSDCSYYCNNTIVLKLINLLCRVVSLLQEEPNFAEFQMWSFLFDLFLI